MKKVAVVLSGCGVFDGAEIHESVLTLLHLNESGVEVNCFAPDRPQLHVYNHAKGEVTEEVTRNVMEESARISRGEITPLSELDVAEFDMVVIPGGFGAAKNLSTFAVNGADCKVEPDVKRVIKEFYAAKKTIAPMCIAPILVARVLGEAGVKVRVTVGGASDAAEAVNAMGAEHVATEPGEVVVDDVNKVVSGPAYMHDISLAALNKGIQNHIKKALELA